MQGISTLIQDGENKCKMQYFVKNFYQELKSMVFLTVMVDLKFLIMLLNIFLNKLLANLLLNKKIIHKPLSILLKK